MVSTSSFTTPPKPYARGWIQEEGTGQVILGNGNRSRSEISQSAADSVTVVLQQSLAQIITEPSHHAKIM